MREVVRAIDAPPAGRHELLGAAHEALRPQPAAPSPSHEALAQVAAGEALRYAIVGNVLTGPVLLALRRVAQEAVSAERFGAGPTG